MLLSLSHKFIFVANLKSASSSIEKALSSHAQFRATKTAWGKHDDLSTISKKFGWVNKLISREEFFVFGVIREPVDFILSLYNFHTGPSFEGKKHSSKGVEFDHFLHTWCVTSWQAKPQYRRFIDRRGKFKISHVIEFSQLETEFPKICSRLGLKATLPRVNVSPESLSRDDLTADQITEIKNRYAEDYSFIENRPRAF